MTPLRPIADLATHTVANQPPPFEDVNLFTSDRALIDAIAAAGGVSHRDRLSALGARAGSAEVIVAREGREVVLSVTDEGPGVPEADIGRLLEPFERGEASRNRETGGSGLGLAIVRAIVEGHGGRLVLANRPQGGLA